MSQTLQWKSIDENPHLVSGRVFELYKKINNKNILVAEINPIFMNGMQFCEEYGVKPEDGANCVIVEAVRGDNKNFVAVVAPVGYRADLNGIVRRHLGVKRVSFAPLDTVIQETGMEYGSITPFGLPDTYKILVDSLIMGKESLIIGGGKQVAKIRISPAIFKDLKNVEIIDGLSKFTPV